MKGKTNTHGPAENFMSTGFTLDGFPSMGAWVTYALGSEDQNLPAFVAIPDPRGMPQNSVNNWAPGFLPAAFQGTAFNATNPIRNLARPAAIPAGRDAATRGFLQRLNERHAERFPGDTELAARIASYELAARMQLTVPEVADLSSEPAHILKLYGADEGGSKVNDTRARLRAQLHPRAAAAREGRALRPALQRRLPDGGEGVGNWDGHKELIKQYNLHGPILDQPTAALLLDLKQRGLLDEHAGRLVHGVRPHADLPEGRQGRDHNRTASPAGWPARA